MANNLSGISYTNNFNNLDGLSIVQADELFVDGTSLDPDNLVPYTGATKTTDLGSQNIKTSRVPTTNSDLTNKLYVDGAVSTGSGDTLGIVNLNFVRYSGSISDTDLGTYKISSSAVPTTANNLTNKTYVDLRVPYTGATSNVVLAGTNNFQQAYNATTSDTTTVVNRQTLDSAIAGLGAGILNLDNTWGYSNTNNLNGGIKTIQNSMQYNSSLDANSYFVVGVSPTTYIFSTNWIINPVAGTTANISLDPALFYFSTSIKYIITFTGIYGTSASWVGTVFNNSTSTTVSDASITATTSSQTLSMTFTPGSNNPTIYLRFVGASGTLRWTNFTIKEVDTEVMGNLILDSQINSNIVQANGKTSNLANGLKVNQTSIATASSLTTASLPSGVSASTLSGSYTLTATAGGTTFGMWLGSSFTYTAGAKYTYTFTGLSTNATATQAMIMYTNTYSGGSGTMIGDYVVNIPITSSTVSGSFTATSNNNVVWNFVSSASGKSVSFTGFTLTRADTEITGTATINSSTTINGATNITGATTITGTASVSGVITATGIATGTPATTIGLNSSNQLIKYANPTSVFTGSVSSTYIPYASSANVLANSNISQTALGDIYVSGFMGVGVSAPVGTLQVQGSGIVCGGTNYANTQGYMASGSLTIGATNKNYGGGSSNWSSNTAGMLLECLDNTEIAIHDAGTTVRSFMYYAGSRIYMGRDMGFGDGTCPIQAQGLFSVGGNSTTGSSKFQVSGAPFSLSGGHVCYYTTADVYPLYQQLNYAHDNIFTGYDLYYDGNFRVSASTGFGFYKTPGTFNLKYANGSQGGVVSLPDAMIVNNGGAIRFPVQPYCRLYGSGNNVAQPIGNTWGANTLFVGQSAGMNNVIGNGWYSAGGLFYAPQTGKYQINATFYWNNLIAGNRLFLRHFNSASVNQADQYCCIEGAGIGGDTVRQYSTMLFMNQGDFFYIQMVSGSNGSTAYFSGYEHSQMSIYMIH
jgi:hypothetical protein